MSREGSQRKGLTIDEANGPTSKCVQSGCHDTLPWLISFSSGRNEIAALEFEPLTRQQTTNSKLNEENTASTPPCLRRHCPRCGRCRTDLQPFCGRSALRHSRRCFHRRAAKARSKRGGGGLTAGREAQHSRTEFDPFPGGHRARLPDRSRPPATRSSRGCDHHATSGSHSQLPGARGSIVPSDSPPPSCSTRGVQHSRGARYPNRVSRDSAFQVIVGLAMRRRGVGSKSRCRFLFCLSSRLNHLHRSRRHGGERLASHGCVAD
jgi:hypothetical protein